MSIDLAAIKQRCQKIEAATPDSDDNRFLEDQRALIAEIERLNSFSEMRTKFEDSLHQATVSSSELLLRVMPQLEQLRVEVSMLQTLNSELVGTTHD